MHFTDKELQLALYALNSYWKELERKNEDLEPCDKLAERIEVYLRKR